MGRTFGELRVIAAADATHRTHTPTPSLRFAGVHFGVSRSSLWRTNANPSAPKFADVSPHPKHVPDAQKQPLRAIIGCR
jgi:hypothetical protein